MAIESFGALLRQSRLTASLSQEALAERAGISAAAIGALETGRRSTPRLETVQRLAEALGLDQIGRRRLLAAAIATRAPDQTAVTAAADVTGDDSGATGLIHGPLPAGMLTFMVADVRGYTAYTHQHGDEAGARLTARFAALAEAVTAGHQGRIVEVRGDEVLAVFTSARRALRAAVDLLARCDATDDPPLRAGVGIDVGEPAPVPGGYRGEALNVAARLCAQAGPGEVLASDAAVGLARHIEGLAFEEHGELPLKGIPRPMRTWLVRAGTEDAPPNGEMQIAAASARPAPLPRHNLPATLSSFIGREQEQARVAAMLRDARLVTLTGAGGVGKTRLALAVAADLVDHYPDGVWLVELAALVAPTLVPRSVAQTLGLLEKAARPTLDIVKDHLLDRRLLLVLDNCEHLVDACAQVAGELLRACPDLRVLATSREGLAVNGEQRFRVPSLSAPASGTIAPHEAAGAYEAVRLFVARARERSADFALTEANTRAVVSICTRLDGIPLAIELAAARVGSMTVEQIDARLDDRFRLLTGGARSAQPRQQTLRAALDWSYDLLADAERILLRRLAAFAGGWTLEAAEAVCASGAIAEWDILDLLGQLDNKSLVLPEQRGAEMRFALLETVRQYAQEKLQAAGDAATIADRHLDWYVTRAERTESLLTGVERQQWLARLELEHDNLRAALRWALSTDPGADPDMGRHRAAQGLRMAAALWRFWYTHGHFSEGRSMLEQTLARAAADGIDAPDLRARALHGAGVLAYSQGDYAAARVLCEESLALYQESGDREGVAVALNILGNVAVSQGDVAHAVALSEQSLALHRELGAERGIAVALNNLGHVLLDQDECESTDGLPYERIENLLAESLALNRKLGERRGMAIALVNLGEVALRRHDHARATACAEDGLALMRELGDRWGTGAALNTLAEVAYAQGDIARAMLYYRQCLPLRQELGDRIGIAECLAGIAGIAGRMARPERAAQLCGAVSALCELSGAPLPPIARAISTATLDAVRALLRDEAFATAWRRGTTMPLDQLIHEELVESATPISAVQG